MDEDKMNAVINTLTEHFMDDGEHGAEAVFNAFAAQHVATFEDGFMDEFAEQKLEYTDVYN